MFQVIQMRIALRIQMCIAVSSTPRRRLLSAYVALFPRSWANEASRHLLRPSLLFHLARPFIMKSYALSHRIGHGHPSARASALARIGDKPFHRFQCCLASYRRITLSNVAPCPCVARGSSPSRSGKGHPPAARSTRCSLLGDCALSCRLVFALSIQHPETPSCNRHSSTALSSGTQEPREVTTNLDIWIARKVLLSLSEPPYADARVPLSGKTCLPATACIISLMLVGALSEL
ncbi:hypothetical protein OH77DRAFT_399694 [Trametes cingulata]|nr:hypothetical protein OH77DRAFT_399694 [Trametes cingulata]